MIRQLDSLARLVALLRVLIPVLFICGCGDSSGLRRVEVSGIVTFERDSSVDGTVRFLPINGNSGPAVSGLIQSGKYQLSGENGPIPGEYRVLLTRSLPKGAGGKLSGSKSEEQQGRLEWLFLAKIPDEDAFQLNYSLSNDDPSVP